MPIRVSIVNPPDLEGEIYFKEVSRCGRKSVAGEIWPQTGLAYLAATLEEAGHTVDIVDSMAEGIALEPLGKRISKFDPHLVIFNTITPTIQNDCKVMRAIHDPKRLWGCVGTHASVLPEETIRESGCDFTLINESEDSIVEVAAALEKHGVEAIRANPPQGFAEVRGGIAHPNGNGGVSITEKRKFIRDLDRLPLPARHLMPMRRYRMPFFPGETFATIIPSRGCPWTCIYCRAGQVYGNAVRTRDPQNLVQEMRELDEKHDCRAIVFMTDGLTFRPDWTHRLCDAIIEAKLPTRKNPVRWICNSRVDNVTLDLLQKMKQAGCLMVSYGVESGSQEILDASEKHITLQQSRDAIRWTREAGMKSMAYFIIGLPGETHETIEQSIRFAREINPDYVNFHVATPFPGTTLYDIAASNNWLVTNDWSQYEEEGSGVMRTEHLSPEDLIAAQKRAMRAFYMRPSRIMRELVALRSWAEFKSKASAGLRVFGWLGTKQSAAGG
jgi:radical SAM superfamily enzyme YgiQ (UPF0313 family)